MAKTDIGPQTVLYPLPTALVSCEDVAGRRSIITISWTGICCSTPPMLCIGVRKSRFSHFIISSSRKFGLNLPTEDQVQIMDFCGNNSGRDIDKFSECHLTPVSGSKSGALLIAECPVSMECEVRHILELGSHDLFVAEITATYIDESVVDGGGKYIMEKLKPIAYMTKSREYRGGFSKSLGRYGEYKDHFK